MRRQKGREVSPLVKGIADAKVADFGGRQDFTYKKLVDLRLSEVSFRHSLFIGAIFQRCHFALVNFDRCDFSGAQFIECTFSRCSFVPDEIRSCRFSGCTFRDCSFRGSQWHRVHVERSSFLNTDFREASIRECGFLNCHFSKCKLKRSSLTLAEFQYCKFGNVDLGDCTALFLFFQKCEFDDCRINAETIGFTYGLTKENIQSLKLIYLGRPQKKPKGVDIVDSLISTYSDRRWYIGACVLKFNFHRSNPVSAIRTVASELSAVAKSGIEGDWDELRFFVRVLRNLHNEQRLPLLGLWIFLATLRDFAYERKSPSALDGLSSAAEPVLAEADKLLLSILDTIAPVLALANSSDQILLTLTLSSRPQIPLSELVPMNVYSLFGGKRVSFVKGRDGSWIETWQIGLGALAAIQISLVAINGVMKQFIKAIENVKRIAKEFTKKPQAQRAQKRSIQKASRRSDVLPFSVKNKLAVNRSQMEGLTVEGLTKLDSTLGELIVLDQHDLSNFQDYSIERIQRISIRRAARVTAPKRGRRERRISA
ncbi:MAG: pentapeptide repeat-containing protein [Afipia sp.]|nr:pentapeptide repeat-containing protein [Afipia sp.]